MFFFKNKSYILLVIVLFMMFIYSFLFAQCYINLNKEMIVNENLCLRKEESVNSKVIATMKVGTKVKILKLGGIETIDGKTSNWVQVQILDGKDIDGKILSNSILGWCFAGYLIEIPEEIQAVDIMGLTEYKISSVLQDEKITCGLKGTSHGFELELIAEDSNGKKRIIGRFLNATGYTAICDNRIVYFSLEDHHDNKSLYKLDGESGQIELILDAFVFAASTDGRFISYPELWQVAKEQKHERSWYFIFDTKTKKSIEIFGELPEGAIAYEYDNDFISYDNEKQEFVLEFGVENAILNIYRYNPYKLFGEKTTPPSSCPRYKLKEKDFTKHQHNQIVSFGDKTFDLVIERSVSSDKAIYEIKPHDKIEIINVLIDEKTNNFFLTAKSPNGKTGVIRIKRNPFQNNEYTYLETLKINNKYIKILKLSDSFLISEGTKLKTLPIESKEIIHEITRKESVIYYKTSGITEDYAWVKVQVGSYEGWIPIHSLSVERGGRVLNTPETIIENELLKLL